MILGLRALSLSMVSYWPWQDLSLSEEPRVCLSSTRPTLKMIFTPARGDVRQGVQAGQGDTISLKCCGAADPSPTNSQDMQEGEFGIYMPPNPQENSLSPPQPRGYPKPALLQVPWL